MKKINMSALTATLLFVPQLAFAHVGDIGLTNSFSQGFLHPILGMDHLIMLLAMGVVAQQAATQKKKLSLIATVIATMFVGVFFGEIVGAINGMEALILGSVFVVAGTIWKSGKDSSGAAKLLISTSIALVLFHGWAHGAELNGASLALFVPGMLLGSLALLSVGYQAAKYIPSKIIAPIVASCGFALTILA